MSQNETNTGPPERVVKIGAADHELCNFIVGTDTPGKTDAQASRALVREIIGTPAHRTANKTCHSAGGYSAPSRYYEYDPYYGYYSASSQDDYDIPTDWGRRYLDNGGAAYVDSHKLEVCTPEVTSAYDFVAANHAMLRIARQAQIAANAKLPDGQKLVVAVNNSDGRGDSWGSHVNTLITRRAWDNIFHTRPHYALFLATHLASSIVCTGAGKVGSENGTPAVDYQIGCRADFMQQTVGQQTMYTRPIVNARDEPLCGRDTSAADSCARLHTITYDANLAHASNFLKFGCLQIICAMIEADFVDPALLLKDPVDAIVRFSHDPLLQTQAETLSGSDYTSVELGLLLLERAREFQQCGGLDGIVPFHEDILALWEDTLNKLKASDFQSLSKRLDWVIKLSAILGAMDQQPELTWDSPTVKHLDFAYANLDPDDGLYWHYESGGLVETLCSEEEIERLVHEPPADTRAWGRSRLLQAVDPEAVADVDWDRIRFKARGGFKPVYRTVDMGGPTDFTKRDVEGLLSAQESLDSLLDTLGAPSNDRKESCGVGAYGLPPVGKLGYAAPLREDTTPCQDTWRCDESSDYPDRYRH